MTPNDDKRRWHAMGDADRVYIALAAAKRTRKAISRMNAARSSIAGITNEKFLIQCLGVDEHRGSLARGHHVPRRTAIGRAVDQGRGSPYRNLDIKGARDERAYEAIEGMFSTVAP